MYPLGCCECVFGCSLHNGAAAWVLVHPADLEMGVVSNREGLWTSLYRFECSELYRGCRRAAKLSFCLYQCCFECFAGQGTVTIPHGAVMPLFAYALVLEI